jgi:hypothetical protein
VARWETIEEKRTKMAERVLQMGGVLTFEGKWTEVSDVAPPMRFGSRQPFPMPDGGGLDNEANEG